MEEGKQPQTIQHGLPPPPPPPAGGQATFATAADDLITEKLGKEGRV